MFCVPQRVKTKETNPTRPGSPTPCKQALSLVFFVLKSLLGIGRQWSHEKFAILTLKPRLSHVRILIYLMWAFIQESEGERGDRKGRKSACFFFVSSTSKYTVFPYSPLSLGMPVEEARK